MAAGRIQKIIWYLELLPKLGVSNVLYVFIYRIRLKYGYYTWKTPVTSLTGSGPVFKQAKQKHDYPEEWKQRLLDQADRIIDGRLPYFSFHWMEQSSPPDWFLNPFNGKRSVESGKHWSKIPDFHEELGDIKCLWEASRFSWLGILARAHMASGKGVYIDTINQWLDDWIRKNPVNQGPNWKCGQEASFRLLALLNAAFVLDQAHSPSEKLVETIRLHVKRISSNMRYAVAQRNNHATSEAAALYIGGNWLLSIREGTERRNQSYARKGRKYLERLIYKLTYEDGSFSQHSVVYHRLLLDTLSSVLFWNRELDLPDLNTAFQKRAGLIFEWLAALVDESGDCPNLGANDGTLLQSNHSCDYRDFRPSLQLASVLLKDRLVFREGFHNEVLYWWGLMNPDMISEPLVKSNRVFQSGYVLMKGKDSWAIIRFPYFKFRPSHNDVMHFDLWSKGSNILVDSGSYSYNPPGGSRVPDLKSVHAHNTLSFDHREQMPRVGRFLMARWLQADEVGQIAATSGSSGSWSGAYKDHAGNMHRRNVSWNDNKWELRDVFTGSASHVEIGFNFSDEHFELDRENNSLVLSWGRISTNRDLELKIKNHEVSPYYFESRSAKRLVISSGNNAEIITTIEIVK